MASEYKVGTISAILAKDSGGGQKADPKLAALFGGPGKSPSSSKVFRTVKVNESQIFKKAASTKSVNVPSGVTAKKVAKKKKEDKIKLKNRDAADIRVGTKNKVKIGIVDVVTPVPLKGLGKKKKTKDKKKKLQNQDHGVQDETVTSTVVEDAKASPAKTDKKKNKRKLEVNDLDQSIDRPVKKTKLERDAKTKTKSKLKNKLKIKKSKGSKDRVETENGAQDDDANGDVVNEDVSQGEKVKSKKCKKPKSKKKLKKTSDTKTGNLDNDDAKEEVEGDRDEANQTKPTDNTTDNAPGVKTLAERNAPKPKDPELEARTLFIGNLPGDVDRKVLKKLFQKYGSIETIRIRGGAPNKPTTLKKVAIIKKELHADKNTVTGYIRFTTREDAENAANKGRGLMIKENHLTLDLADQGKKKDNKKAIFVGNLNLKLSDEELWRFFEDCGTIVSVRVIRDNETGLGKGFGYVNFEEKESVAKALEKNQQELARRNIRISRCVKKLKVKKVPVGKKPGAGKAGGKGKFKRGDTEASTEYGGDKLAEIGKLKRKSKKPNRGELRKANIAKLLTGKAPPVAIASSNARNSRQASYNPSTGNKKRYFR